jgi:hypothetical protein
MDRQFQASQNHTPPPSRPIFPSHHTAAQRTLGHSSWNCGCCTRSSIRTAGTGSGLLSVSGVREELPTKTLPNANPSWGGERGGVGRSTGAGELVVRRAAVGMQGVLHTVDCVDAVGMQGGGGEIVAVIAIVMGGVPSMEPRAAWRGLRRGVTSTSGPTKMSTA